MWKNKTFYFVAAVILAVAAGYLVFYRQEQVKQQLNQVLDETLKDKEQLQSQVVDLQGKLQEKQRELAALSDVAAIRQAMINAQSDAENLTKEFDRINKERASLQEQNVSLNTRLQNTTKEYMKTLTDLKNTQEQRERLNKEQSPDKRKVDDLNKKIQEKEAESAKLKTDLDALKKDSQSSLSSAKTYEKRIKDLEAERSQLLAKVENSQTDIGTREGSVKDLQVTIAKLKDNLADKEGQIRQLEQQLEKQGVPTVEAPAPKGPVDRGDARFAKAEMNRLSSILVQKEFEIESAKKDALQAKEELVALQGKLSEAQNSLYTTRVNQEKLRELENQRFMLQSQLTQVQQDLIKRNELIESLKKNVDYLTVQVDKKDQEKASLEAKLSVLDTSSKDDLMKEKKRSDEIDMMYSSLKAQISQFSDAITLKEAEIANKQKEIASLREEVSGLKSRSAQLDEELLEAKESQRKIMDDLSAAVRLNAVLQERIKYAPSLSQSDVSSSSGSDKKKADELKRKIEVILEPEKQ